MKGVLIPELITGRLFSIGCQPVGFDSLNRQSRDVFESQVEYCMFCHRAMPISNHPFFMKAPELSSFNSAAISSRAAASVSFGKSDRDGLWTVFPGSEKINSPGFSHFEKSFACALSRAICANNASTPENFFVPDLLNKIKADAVSVNILREIQDIRLYIHPGLFFKGGSITDIGDSWYTSPSRFTRVAYTPTAGRFPANAQHWR